MYPVIFPLYGSLAINTYGFFIALGVMISIFFIKKDNLCIKQGIDKYIIQILYAAFFGAFFGGKLMHYILKPELLVSWLDVFLPWRGGFAVLGSVVGAACCLVWYFSQTKHNILITFDCIAPYIPLLQSIGRIGCFFAGCCYGKNNLPIQLYSSAFLFIIFLYLYQNKNKSAWNGKMLLQYIMLVSAERFIIDYWRAEKVFGFNQQIISHNQLFALILFSLSGISYTTINNYFNLELKN